MSYLMDQPMRDRVPPYILYTGKLTVAECEKLIAYAQRQGTRAATVGNASAAREVPATRKSRVAWAYSTAETRWLYDKLNAVADDARRHWYPFDLSGFHEPVQLTHYSGSELGHYSAHKDLAAGRSSTRKLSMVALLNDPKEFEGGQLEMLAAPSHARQAKLGQGSLVVFPAYELHRVTPVTHGQRWSAVVWVHGPPFR